jgi:F0F1-type ATP synthase epsilon subunit
MSLNTNLDVSGEEACLLADHATRSREVKESEGMKRRERREKKMKDRFGPFGHGESNPGLPL